MYAHFFVQGGDEEKFKLVVEAHAVLSDPQRRERYDMGEDEDGQNGSGMGPFGNMQPADLADIFTQFQGGGPFGGGGGFRFHAGGHSGDFDF